MVAILIALGVGVVIHALLALAVSRLLKFHTTDVSFGVGPALLHRQFGARSVSLRLLPVAACVEVTEPVVEEGVTKHVHAVERFFPLRALLLRLLPPLAMAAALAGLMGLAELWAGMCEVWGALLRGACAPRGAGADVVMTLRRAMADLGPVALVAHTWVALVAVSLLPVVPMPAGDAATAIIHLLRMRALDRVHGAASVLVLLWLLVAGVLAWFAARP